MQFVQGENWWWNTETKEDNNVELLLDDEGMNMAIGEVEDVENNNDVDFEVTEWERSEQQIKGKDNDNTRWVIISTTSYDVAVSIGKCPILAFIYLNRSSSCFSKS